MLRRLSLRDFVIVAELEVDFAPGCSVLTGETGAGKSILIDALQLAALAGDGSAPQKNTKTTSPRGAISASGHVAWSPQLKADLQAELSHVDPSMFAAGVPGDLNGRLDTHTTMTGARPTYLSDSFRFLSGVASTETSPT